jgi:hypothetical protein
MPVIIVIEKSGTIKELAMKTNQETELFKRAGFKTSTDFKLHTTFNESNYNIRLYGKTKGKAGQENKYEFPPPVDNILFFGCCLLINTSDNGDFLNLTKKEWNDVYNKLFGGFDELDNTNELEDDEPIIPSIKLTKEGYMKDGFIVDDNSEIVSESETETETEIIPLKSVIKSKKITKNKVSGENKPVKSPKTPKKSKIVLEDTSIHSSFLECKEELEEETYFS